MLVSPLALPSSEAVGLKQEAALTVVVSEPSEQTAPVALEAIGRRVVAKAAAEKVAPPEAAGMVI